MSKMSTWTWEVISDNKIYKKNLYVITHYKQFPKFDKPGVGGRLLGNTEYVTEHIPNYLPTNFW